MLLLVVFDQELFEKQNGMQTKKILSIMHKEPGCDFGLYSSKAQGKTNPKEIGWNLL